MQETQQRTDIPVQSGGEDPWEQNDVHSSIFQLRIHAWENQGASKESDTTKQQTQAENSSGAWTTDSASTDKTNEVDSVAVTVYISSVLPEGLELSTYRNWVI